MLNAITILFEDFKKKYDNVGPTLGANFCHQTLRHQLTYVRPRAHSDKIAPTSTADGRGIDEEKW
jgi:hypothetical protein